MANRANRKRRRGEEFPMAQTRREIAVTRQYTHSGPIPDPMTLERYESILPGAAERILSMAEEQSKHRRQIEEVVIQSRSRDSKWGIISGFILAAMTIIAGAYVSVNGQAWSGTVLGSAGLVGLVSVFVYGTNSARKERESQG